MKPVAPEDLADILYETLKRRTAGEGLLASRPAAASVRERPAAKGFPVARPFNEPYKGPQKGRIFLSEYDIKRMLENGGGILRVPRGAILSPLAEDWMAARNVRVEYD